MRIAIIGSSSIDSLEWNLKEAFEFAGNESRIFDVIKHFSNARLNSVSFAFDKICRTYSDSYDRKIFDNLFKKVQQYGPDLVVGVYRFIHPSFVQKVKLQGMKIIHINPDAITTFQYQQLFASDYDVYFTKDPYIVSFMKNNMHLNAKLYNEAFNVRYHIKPNEDKLEYEKKYDIDVMTYGTLYPYRCRMLQVLADNGINLRLYGVKPHRFYDGKLDKYFQNKYLIGREKAQYLYGSKIVFNQMHYAEIESVNNRFFEVNGAGAFQLSDYRPILKTLLPIDPSLVSFRSIDEGLEKIKYYLTHDQERKEIAETIYHHFISNYTYDHLVSYILSEI